MNPPLKTAIHVPTEKFIHIDNAKNGNDCNCKCYKCGELLTARQGEKNTSHFSHRININCTGGSPITLLHKLAQRIIVESTEIKVSETESWYYTAGEAEKTFKGEIPLVTPEGEIIEKTPDVTANSENGETFFEVAVTSPKTENEKKFYRINKKRCLEIKLKDPVFYLTFASIKNDVLIEWRNKEIIYPEMVKPEMDSPKPRNDFWEWLKAIVVVAIVLKLLYEFLKWLRRMIK